MSHQSNRASSHRTRTAPRERFEPSEQLYDLDAAADALVAERRAGQHGHRQITLFHHGSSTLALYCFEEAGSRLPEHVVDGPVIVHVLDGRLVVHADEAEHEVPAGTLLRLSPGVRHDVIARESTRALLTFCVEGPGSHG